MTEAESHSQGEPGQYKARLQSLYDSADVLLLLVLFVVLVGLSTTYEESARQFPQVFMYAGIVVLGVELLINLLPERYSATLERYTSGLADDMALEDEGGEEISPDMSVPTEEHETTENIRQQLRRLALVLGLVVGYFLAAYLISFLFATPLFVFATVFTLGSRDYRIAILLSMLFMLMIYGLFGELMNVPIMEGILVS